jgi:CYTH domain-containing protein
VSDDAGLPIPTTSEIERKFLVDAAIPELGHGTPIRQGYVAEEGEVEVRIRITPDAALVTIKAGRGRDRTEVELPLSIGEAEALWPHTAGRRIDKVRHRRDLGDGVVAEVDVYAGALAGSASWKSSSDRGSRRRVRAASVVRPRADRRPHVVERLAGAAGAPD